MRLWSVGKARHVTTSVMGRLTQSPVPVGPERADWIIYGTTDALAAFGDDWAGYAGVLSPDPENPANPIPIPVVYAPPHLEYLLPGDVVQLLPSGTVQVLYRRASQHNTILATERCNSF